jgi:uncharacterized SAM-binding protein YcdF (DUF218 family)
VLLLIGIACVALGIRLVSWARTSKKDRWPLYAVVPLAGVGLTIAGAPTGFLLSKSLGLLAMPLGLLWLATFVAILVLAWKARYRGAALATASFVALTLSGNEAVSDLASRAVEGSYADIRPFDRGHFDAIIVLGGGTASRPGGGVQLGASGDRLMLAARLYHRGQTPILVTSGSPIAGLSSHDSVRASVRIWRDLRIPDEAIVRVQGARTTSEEAPLHASLIRERGWRRVGLVSSAAHMPRALGLFEREGVRVIPLPAHVTSGAIEWRGFHSLIPTAGAALNIQTACWETVGRLAGR